MFFKFFFPKFTFPKGFKIIKNFGSYFVKTFPKGSLNPYFHQ